VARIGFVPRFAEHRENWLWFDADERVGWREMALFRSFGKNRDDWLCFGGEEQVGRRELALFRRFAFGAGGLPVRTPEGGDQTPDMKWVAKS
jgi:hypothetical protein